MAPATRMAIERKQESDKGNDVIEMDMLPNEIVNMCLAELSARDLLHMEMVWNHSLFRTVLISLAEVPSVSQLPVRLCDVIFCSQINHRLRDLVLQNNNLWKDKVKLRWGMQANNSLLEASSVLAGGWKNLYAQKHVSEKRNKPWVVPSDPEIEAILELVRGDSSLDRVGSPISLSPTSSVMSEMAPARGLKRGLTVLLLLDGSSSVTREDFDAMKSFTRKLIDNLRERRPDSAVGLIQFNQSPRTIIPICDISEDIPERVDKMQQLMGSTDIAAPIKTAHELLTEDGNFGGDAVVLLLSDGQTSTSELEASQREARSAAELMGVRLFAFGVGRDVDEMGLNRIAASTHIECEQLLDGTIIPERPGGAYLTLRRMERSML
mmetsp:Transcript_39744/g.158130  ORF Transcript_39744/g.158130 Transcript_39744/m.158130 type:complete len:380 (-) Transcript_39744:2413-3552(-)